MSKNSKLKKRIGEKSYQFLSRNSLNEKLEELKKLELPDLPPYGGDNLLICNENLAKLELPNLRSVS